MGCFTVAAQKTVKLDADIPEAKPLLLAAGWTLLVLGLLSQHFKFFLQITRSRHPIELDRRKEADRFLLTFHKESCAPVSKRLRFVAIAWLLAQSLHALNRQQ